MPTYDYRCNDCGFEEETFQSIVEAPLHTCPHCGKETFERVISGGAGVLYKGEGWYVTDYSKKSSGGKDTKPATTTPPPTTSTTPAPADSKTAAPTSTSE